jgi:hypothetical protein
MLAPAVALAGEQVPAAHVLSHTIRVRVDPSTSWLVASDRLEIEMPEERSASGEVGLLLNRGLEIKAAFSEKGMAAHRTLEPVSEGEAIESPARVVALRLPWGVEAGSLLLTIAYSGAPVPVTTEDGGPGSWITPEWIFLPPGAYWYPASEVEGERPPTFSLRVIVPPSLEVVGEGGALDRGLEEEQMVAVWKQAQALPGVHLIAGSYRLTEERHDDLTLAIYLRRDAPDLARDLLATATAELDHLTREFGPYPWPSFAVVEGGSQEAPLPGAVSVSVLESDRVTDAKGREIMVARALARGFWGQGVLPVKGEESLARGIVTYFVDHRRAELAGEGRRFRRELLVAEERAREAHEPDGVSVGRAVMVLHMLEEMVGLTPLKTSLRQLVSERAERRAGWDALAARLGGAVGERLDWTIEQWIRKPGVLDLELRDASRSRTGDGRYDVSFTLRQGDGTSGSGRPYRLEVPVTIKTAGGPLERVVRMTGQEEAFTLRVTPEPLLLRIDPDLHLYRLLKPEDMDPPSAPEELTHRFEPSGGEGWKSSGPEQEGHR